jgi:hypothetical protein
MYCLISRGLNYGTKFRKLYHIPSLMTSGKNIQKKGKAICGSAFALL